MFSSTGEAISSIWSKKGLVGFYEGYWGGFARDVPFRVAQLTTYELIKNLYLQIKCRRMEREAARAMRGVNDKSAEKNFALTPVEAAFCGAVAGTFSAATTAPLDRIKTLLMTNSVAYGGTVASCAAKIWREEGVQGFAAGVLPRVVYIGPSVVIFFVVFEMTQQKLQHLQSPPRNF